MLFATGAAPAGAKYEVDNSVSRETTITLSLQNAPFQAAIDAVCQAAGLQYKVQNDVYTFSNKDGQSSNIIITVRDDRLGWKLSGADPIDAAKQLLTAFKKKYDIDLSTDPSAELDNVAQRIAQDLQQAPSADQASRLKDIKANAQHYIKPPKVLAPGTRKSLSLEDDDLSFSEAMDTLGDAGGFLWFRHSDGKIVIRNSTSADQVKQIFQRAKIWDALQK